MSKKIKVTLLLISSFIVFCFGLKFYLDKTYLDQFDRNRIIGKDRYETMVKISNKGWKTSEEALLINVNSVIDGISVSSFAYKNNIPVFFTESDELNNTIKDEIKNLGVKKIYLVGGEKVISKGIKKQLDNINVKTERIGGKDGFETSILFAQKVAEKSKVSEIALVNMKYGKPNGVAMASAAAKDNIPIIIMNKSDRKEIIEFVNKYNIKKVYFVGDESSFPKAFEDNMPKVVRINGEDRYDTNIQIIKEFYDLENIKDMYITRDGTVDYADFINALSLSPIAAKTNTPILFSSKSLGEKELEFLKENKIKKITEVGFELTRPKIITENMIKFGSSISIIVIWILAIKRVI